MNEMPIHQATRNLTAPEPSPLAKKLGRRRTMGTMGPMVDEDPRPLLRRDPRTGLRRVVSLHKRWTRTATSWVQSVSDREFTDPVTGKTETILCTVPLAVRVDIKNAAKALQRESARLERTMSAWLKQTPIWQHFLSGVYGFGPVTNAYLCSMVDIHKCEKVSNLIRYCGNACDAKTGKRELRSGAPKAQGGTGTFNDELKMRIWQGMCAIRKACARHGKDETRYLKRWNDAKHTSQSQRGTLGKPDGFAENKGRRKATDLLLWDLYVVWRTLEGLPVWPDKWATERGFFHGGAPVWDAPRVLTLDEALEMVK